MVRLPRYRGILKVFLMYLMEALLDFLSIGQSLVPTDVGKHEPPIEAIKNGVSNIIIP